MTRNILDELLNDTEASDATEEKQYSVLRTVNARRDHYEEDTSWHDDKPTKRQVSAMIKALRRFGLDNDEAREETAQALEEAPTKKEFGDLLGQIFTAVNRARDFRTQR